MDIERRSEGRTARHPEGEGRGEGIPEQGLEGHPAQGEHRSGAECHEHPGNPYLEQDIGPDAPGTVLEQRPEGDGLHADEGSDGEREEGGEPDSRENELPVHGFPPPGTMMSLPPEGCRTKVKDMP